jgi:hypothetical protein
VKKKWVAANAAGELDRLENLGGVRWNIAPAPRWWHWCTAQTRGWVGLYDLHYIERCACGAIRLQDHGPWTERNTRKRKR